MLIRKGIKDIVSYVYQSGDLNLEYFSLNRAQLGTQAHQAVQKHYKKEECEVHVEDRLEAGGHEIIMSGRMDLLQKEGDHWTVGEIKSTTRDLDQIRENDRPDHYAQAKFYAYILLKQNPRLQTISIRLIYCDLEGIQQRSFYQEYELEALEHFVRETLEIYVEWAAILAAAQGEKLKSAKALEFPFGKFRPHQRDLAAAVYHCVKDSKQLLLRAPTGIGKTMATLFPSIKALTDGEQKIFYFTAKTVGRSVAEKAFAACHEKGFQGKCTTITAKDKTCFMEETRCDPAYCPYAKGFFDRLREATRDLYTSETLFNRPTLEAYAKKHQVCPFEFSLSMANISDAVIGDYNYIFDPRAYLKRFFDEPSPHIALIDEAHNLYDRACDMYSAALTQESILKVRRLARVRFPNLAKPLSSLSLKFTEYSRGLEEDAKEEVYQKDLDQNFLSKVQNAMQALERVLQEDMESEERTIYVNLYFELLQFNRIADFFIESFRVRYRIVPDDMEVSIICLDPGPHLAYQLKKVRSAILFSATLHPLDYFHSVLLGDAPCEKLFLPSPFVREHLNLMVNHGVSTTYRDRHHSLQAIARNVYGLTRERPGNYLIFFPSYQYMEQVFEVYEGLAAGVQRLAIQERLMKEEERDDFLGAFYEQDDRSLVAFAVMGGVFGEGIDLTGEALVGAVIVGVGLPQINSLTEQRRLYFEESFGEGFRYAYQIPGFNKVMQAVGRVIRTDTDEGSALLIDSRFARQEYLDLFPYEWQHAKFYR